MLDVDSSPHQTSVDCDCHLEKDLGPIVGLMERGHFWSAMIPTGTDELQEDDRYTHSLVAL
jgi:hypothetical protein